jgi:soluble lytic murein transglycosylase-like protein
LTLLAVLSQCKVYIPSHPPPMHRRASLVPPSVLWAIAEVESDCTELAVSRDGLDLGMFQLRSLFHGERARQYGAFNPFDAADSARIAGRILADAYRYFGDWPRAITSYNRGVGWTRRHGVDIIYLNKVRGVSWAMECFSSRK